MPDTSDIHSHWLQLCLTSCAWVPAMAFALADGPVELVFFISFRSLFRCERLSTMPASSTTSCSLRRHKRSESLVVKATPSVCLRLSYCSCLIAGRYEGGLLIQLSQLCTLAWALGMGARHGTGHWSLLVRSCFSCAAPPVLWAFLPLRYVYIYDKRGIELHCLKVCRCSRRLLL